MDPFLPKFIYKYFWGDDFNQLHWKNHQKYIIQTILEKGDRRAASWLLAAAGKTTIKQQLDSLSLSPRSARFWKLYLS